MISDQLGTGSDFKISVLDLEATAIKCRKSSDDLVEMTWRSKQSWLIFVGFVMQSSNIQRMPGFASQDFLNPDRSVGFLQATQLDVGWKLR